MNRAQKEAFLAKREHERALARARSRRHYNSGDNAEKKKAAARAKRAAETATYAQIAAERAIQFEQQLPLDAAPAAPAPAAPAPVRRRTRGSPPLDLTLAQLVDLLANDTRIAAKKTRETYIRDAKRVFNLGNCRSIIECFKNPDELISNIINGKQKRTGERYSDNSIKQTFQIMVYIFDKYLDENYLTPQQFKSLKAPFLAEFRKYEFLSRENSNENAKRAVPTFEAYLKLAEEKWGTDSRQYLIASIYSLFTARDDFLLTVIKNPADDSGEGNYLLVWDGTFTFILNNFKTKKHTDTIKFRVSKTIPAHKRLAVLLRNWMAEKKVAEGDYLFKIKTPLSPIVSKMNKELGYEKSRGINFFRHMRVSERIPGATVQQRIDLAKEMGHSLMTQSNYQQALLVNDQPATEVDAARAGE